MKLRRRQFLYLVAGAATLPAVSHDAGAQSYPARPITLIVPFAAGAAADVVARIVAERMTNLLGQPVIVENVSGAEGSIGVGRAARARPDGYTIDLGGTGNHVLNGALNSPQYDVLNDFAPISPLGTSSWLLFVRKTIPPKNLKELIDWLKANPNKASGGIANVEGRLLTTFFQKVTGTRFALVPYRGGTPAFQDLVANQIDLLFGLPFQLPLVRSGSIRAFAVTGDKRLAEAPDIPTFSEMGMPVLSFSSWSGFFAPKGTAKDIIGKLNAATAEALRRSGGAPKAH
jgi:tripartite-type tricarboxylate transporter receptor subunit TctC